ncbi:MAG: HAD family hydrolase [Armatimonadota bacterium]
MSPCSSSAATSLLFDLDGTLTDPAEGITRCLTYALEKLGRLVPCESELRACIGPPLQETLPVLLGTNDPVLACDALGLYRERFSSIGKFENAVYPGIPEALTALCSHGYRLLIATSKPTVYAKDILSYFGLDAFFEGVYGSELSGERSDKTALIKYLLADRGLAADACLMIGDRKQDVVGAHQNGVACIGVLWGFGSQEELTSAGADWLCSLPSHLYELEGSIVSVSTQGVKQ